MNLKWIVTRSRRKVAIAHPYLGRGGSEARVMWAIEALKVDCDVSVITTGGADLEGLNQAYQTQVRPDEVTFRVGGGPSMLANVGDAWRCSLHQRYCQSIAREFDVLISAYNFVDFGVPAIHCIADFCWDETIRKELHPAPPGGRGMLHRDGFFRRMYLGAGRLMARPSGRDLFAGEDMILANSRWSADIIRHKYGSTVDVLYPPVLADKADDQDNQREIGFVCLGRIAPEKRIERIIEILHRLRHRGHDIHLHVIGNPDGSAYGEKIKAMCQDEQWVALEGAMYGREKTELLTRHRYAIHACQGEAFGIAVAEMVNAGCITFAPVEGGQAEIVDHAALLYADVNDAVEKIDRVLGEEQLRRELDRHLSARAALFTPQRFMTELREAVHRFVGDRTGVPEAS